MYATKKAVHLKRQFNIGPGFILEFYGIGFIWTFVQNSEKRGPKNCSFVFCTNSTHDSFLCEGKGPWTLKESEFFTLVESWY